MSNTIFELIDGRVTARRDSGEKLDYFINWNPELAPTSDTISTSTWTVSPNLTMTSASVAGGFATIWLTGGEPGVLEWATNRVTTAAGRIFEQTLYFQMDQK